MMTLPKAGRDNICKFQLLKIFNLIYCSLTFQVSQDIKSMIDVEAERHRGVVDPRDVKQGGAKFYKYKGSLTVPPCTEGVTWIIHKKVLTSSSSIC